MNAGKYAVIFERGLSGCSAYSPDLPGCVAAGETEEEVRLLMAQAMEFHIEGLTLSGLPVPEPSSSVEYIEVPA